jgi:DNA-binding NarL/FixJ family response regulator
MRQINRPTIGLDSAKVLVAHPSARMASLICSALRMVGVVETKRVTTSQAARNALLAKSYHAAIVSFDLKPDGPAVLAQQLRDDTIDVPVIAISTGRDRITLEATSPGDLDAVVLLPVSATVLGTRLLAVIERRQIARNQYSPDSIVEI